MKRFTFGLVCLAIVCVIVSTSFADETRRIKKTDPATNLITMAQIELRQDGWYGPYRVAWLELGLDYLYVEFASGAWVLLNPRFFDTSAIASVATACKNHSRIIFLEVVNDSVYGFQIQ